MRIEVHLRKSRAPDKAHVSASPGLRIFVRDCWASYTAIVTFNQFRERLLHQLYVLHGLSRFDTIEQHGIKYDDMLIRTSGHHAVRSEERRVGKKWSRRRRHGRW